MSKCPPTFLATLILIVLNALIWLALGVIIVIHAHPAIPDSPTLQGVMAVLSFGAAAILLGLLFSLGKRSRAAWFIAVGFLVVASLLTIFDDFGWIDLVVLVLNIVPIVLLIKDRAWFLHEKLNASEGS